MKITSKEGRESLGLDIDLPRNAKRLILVDADGREYHFRCGVWTSNGTFIHVATYTSERREPYAWWSDVCLTGSSEGGGFEMSRNLARA